MNAKRDGTRFKNLSNCKPNMTNISPPHVYAYIAMFKVDMGPGCYTKLIMWPNKHYKDSLKVSIKDFSMNKETF